MPTPFARFKQRWRQRWHDFSAEPLGLRFERHHERQQLLDAQRSKPYLVARALLGVVFLLLGIVFTFIPGPAIAFFVLTAVIVASHSLKVARWLDRADVCVEHWWQILRSKWRQWRRPSDVP